MYRMIVWGALIIVLGFLAYVRFSPSDPARWHKQAYPSGLGEKPSKAGYVWRSQIVGDGLAELAALDDVVRQTARTRLLAGSVAQKQLTYVTRSRVFGFPDYTTIGVYDGLIEDEQTRYLEINSRLRFGGSDLGVNRARAKGWLTLLQAG